CETDSDETLWSCWKCQKEQVIEFGISKCRIKMQNELNTNKYLKLAYSANRCRCAVKSVPRASSSRNFRRGDPPPPSLYATPVVKNPPRKAHKDPVTAEVCTL
ncbi:Hypothetical protein FKW44_019766, partial [Caligus rogercresseyi]